MNKEMHMRSYLRFAVAALALALSCLAMPATAQTSDPGATPVPGSIGKLTRTVLMASGVPQAATPAAMQQAPVFMSGDCCGDHGCGKGWHVIGEIGFMILKPVWNSNPALLLQPTGTSTQVLDFDFGPQFVPKISLGAVNADGFGGRIGWWGFARTSIRGAPNVNPTGDNRSATPLGLSVDDSGDVGDSLVAHGKLNMNVWDFEVVKTFQASSYTVRMSGGIRYAHIAQIYRATAFDTDDGIPDIDTDNVFSGHSFNGAGPTLSLEGAYRLGGGPLSLYSSGRGALLFGQIKQRADVIQFNDDGTVDNHDSASSSNEAIVPVGELEIGVAWDREWGRGHLFFRGGLVGQMWFGAGNSSRSSPLLNEGPSGEGGSIGDEHLGLIGFSLTAGVRY